MYNHKQRREMEKQLGLLKSYQKMSEREKAEVREKKRRAGEQIHLRNLQEAENQRSQAEADNEAKQIQSWVDAGKTYEEAEAIVRNNREIKRAREEKKAAQEEKARMMILQRIEEEKKKKEAKLAKKSH